MQLAVNGIRMFVEDGYITRKNVSGLIRGWLQSDYSLFQLSWPNYSR